MIDGMRVCDLHGHEEGLLSAVPGAKVLPEDTPVRELGRHGIDLMILCAVGDPASFGAGENTWNHVTNHLSRIVRTVESGTGAIVTDLHGMKQAWESGRTAVFLGLEGADALTSFDQLEELHSLGVRFIGPVHYSSNRFGITGMALDGSKPEDSGLTDVGSAFVERAQSLGMVVDVAHASDQTVLDICRSAGNPVFCSHGALKRYLDATRYLGDEAAAALRDSGGMLGLWPCRIGTIGPAGIDDIARMIIDAGSWFSPGQIGMGTDVNGAPGYPTGYRGPRDTRLLADSLLGQGYSREHLKGFLGGNLVAFLTRYWS
jgi:microsomal dipeptidase-like Zn-dependent dipeptidase